MLVTVNEAKDTPEFGRWSERRAVYERLKELVDPRAIERTFLKKGQQAFQAPAFASYLIASNNRDALQIPPGDRRVAALANGGQLPGAQAKVLQAWMEQPGNIAALAGFLEAPRSQRLRRLHAAANSDQGGDAGAGAQRA